MKLLLDSHIFLWGLLEPQRLSERVAHELEDDANELWLSPITIWECLLLAARGRVELRPDPRTWLRDQLAQLRPTEAPINQEVAFRSRELKLAHEDPADRFLVATAAIYELTLVTADARLLKTREISVLANK